MFLPYNVSRDLPQPHMAYSKGGVRRQTSLSHCVAYGSCNAAADDDSEQTSAFTRIQAGLAAIPLDTSDWQDLSASHFMLKSSLPVD